MPEVPQSREAIALTALKLYLEQQTQTYNTNITWDDYNDIQSPDTPPKGYIETPKGLFTDQHTLDFQASTNYYHIYFMVSHSDSFQAQILAVNWRSLLSNTIMKNLSNQGVEVTDVEGTFFKGIRLEEWAMEIKVNQDNGAMVKMLLKYYWDDVGDNTGIFA